ncbi:hypothetical protein [Rhodanobacter sp. BL-MT-08]
MWRLGQARRHCPLREEEIFFFCNLKKPEYIKRLRQQITKKNTKIPMIGCVTPRCPCPFNLTSTSRNYLVCKHFWHKRRHVEAKLTIFGQQKMNPPWQALQHAGTKPLVTH